MLNEQQLKEIKDRVYNDGKFGYHNQGVSMVRWCGQLLQHIDELQADRDTLNESLHFARGAVYNRREIITENLALSAKFPDVIEMVKAQEKLIAEYISLGFTRNEFFEESLRRYSARGKG